MRDNSSLTRKNLEVALSEITISAAQCRYFAQIAKDDDNETAAQLLDQLAKSKDDQAAAILESMYRSVDSSQYAAIVAHNENKVAELFAQFEILASAEQSILETSSREIDPERLYAVRESRGIFSGMSRAANNVVKYFKERGIGQC